MDLKDLTQTIREKCLFLQDRTDLPILSQSGTPNRFIIDLRSLLLDPVHLEFIADEFWKRYPSRSRLQVAGLELASVPLMSAIILKAKAHGCKANALIIRKSRKKYGLNRTIEGDPDREAETVVVDDLVNSGSSIQKTLTALWEIGIHPKSAFTVMDYENPEKKKLFEARGIQHEYLVPLSDVYQKPRSGPQLRITGYSTRFCFRSELPYNRHQIFCRSSPCVDDERVYFGTDSAVFFAIDKNSGTLRWKHEAIPNSALKGIWSSPVIVGDGVCFGAYDGNLYLLDRATGSVKWVFSHANFIGSSPEYAPDLGLIFIGLEFAIPGKMGSIAAVNAATGELAWEHSTSQYVHSSPIYSPKHQMVFCGSNDHDFTALDANTGKMLWRVSLGGGTCKMKAAMHPSEDSLFIGTNDGQVRAIETLTGRTLWSYKAKYSVLATPLLVGEKLFVSGLDDLVHVIDSSTGASIKTLQTDGRIMGEPALHEGRVFVGNNSGAVFEIDVDALEFVGRYQLPDRVLSRVAYSQDNRSFYVHTSDERLFCFQRT